MMSLIVLMSGTDPALMAKKTKDIRSLVVRSWNVETYYK